MTSEYQDHRLLGTQQTLFNRDTKFEHETSEMCLCDPECVYVDPDNGNEVWVHRMIGSV